MVETHRNGARPPDQGEPRHGEISNGAPAVARESPPPQEGVDPVLNNVEEVVGLGRRDRMEMGWADRLADRITAFSGSMVFVALHVLWFAGWIAINLGLLGVHKFDPFPFGLLTMVVSLEAIFLSTFVLISQNRQAFQADRRAKVTLQIDALAEQEATKLIQMVAEIQEHLGIRHRDDPEMQALKSRTHIEKLADAIDQAESKHDSKGARAPDSAVDAEA
jgi:uncharacterized membrane protein